MDNGDRVEGIDSWVNLFAVPRDMAQLYRNRILLTVEPRWRDWFAAVGDGLLPPWPAGAVPPAEYMLAEESLEGATPLIYCAWLGRLEWVEYLLARGDSPDACDSWERPPFYAAIAAGHSACAKVLRQKDLKLNEPMGVLGELALNIVVLHDNPPQSRVELMAWLLATGADPSVKDRSGDTALLCSPVYMELEEQSRDRQAPGKQPNPAKPLSVYTSGSCLKNDVAVEIFEKLLLLTDVSDGALGITAREFKIELRERKSALVERKAIAKELETGSSKSGGREGRRL